MHDIEYCGGGGSEISRTMLYDETTMFHDCVSELKGPKELSSTQNETAAGLRAR